MNYQVYIDIHGENQYHLVVTLVCFIFIYHRDAWYLYFVIVFSATLSSSYYTEYNTNCVTSTFTQLRLGTFLVLALFTFGSQYAWQVLLLHRVLLLLTLGTWKPVCLAGTVITWGTFIREGTFITLLHKYQVTIEIQSNLKI